MGFLGLYTEKELKEAKISAKEFGRLEGVQEAKRKHIKEKDILENKIADLKNENEKANEKVSVLSGLLVREVDKDTVKLEKISKRTKKLRIKKKCENAILRNRMKKLVYERC